MFHHAKELEFNARVSAPDPRFASLLLEQFGGANGELKAAMQYFLPEYKTKSRNRVSHQEQLKSMVNLSSKQHCQPNW